MKSTMQDTPLLISSILRHGAWLYGDQTAVTCEADGYRSATFAIVAERAERLAWALHHLGVEVGDRVGTLCWNNQEHLELFMGVPSMGAVLHTLNPRLFPEQLAYVINHGGDRVIVVDASLVPVLGRVQDELTTVETIIVRGDDQSPLLKNALNYDDLLASERPGYAWPDLDERSAAAMCYTSGTTGNPKGVVYSHRSTYLHSMAWTSSNGPSISERDRTLVVVPMFHANGWGAPYTAFLAGSGIVLPQHFLQGTDLLRIISQTRPTIAIGVPTVWNSLLEAAESSDSDLSSLERVIAGGSAVPRRMIEDFRDQLGIPLIQGWGMTEMSPLGALAIPPHGSTEEEHLDYYGKAGRVIAGVEVRICDEDGRELPKNGKSVGEFEVRGSWVTASYFGSDDSEKFHDGWLRTGDVGSLDGKGYMTIWDRTKDVIKSGGEWISSVELENEIMAHRGVYEAAVIAIPNDKWQERPLVCIVARPGVTPPTLQELNDFLLPRVASWWLPDQWAFVDVIPKTSVGKFDKKSLRNQFANGELTVIVHDHHTRR